MTDISIIMGVRGRPDATRRCLQSYTKLNHNSYEILFVDVEPYNSPVTMRPVYREFKYRLPIRYFHLKEDFSTYVEGKTTWTPATTWNFGFTQAQGKFIITTGADLLITSPGLLDAFVSQFKDRRLAVPVYFLSSDMTKALDTINWYDDPSCVQRLPKFWDEIQVGQSNHQRGLVPEMAVITTYLTGQSRERWEWFGKYRSELSHLVNDQDIVMRERCLKQEAEVVKGQYVYHQAHPSGEWEPGDTRSHAPGWNYHSELQARLLEPAPRDEV